QTQLVSRNLRAESTRIAAIRGTWQASTAVWFDESDPSTDHDIATIENGIASLRWIDNSYQLTYSQRTGPDRGQVLLLDTATNAAQVITNDAGDKTDPYGWYAPDFGGEMLVLAIVDNAAVAVYRDTGGAYWERIATLQPPPEAGATFISSAEPFVVGGRSYISLIIKNATDTRERFSHSEVWLFDVNEDPTTRYTERCDSGESGLARSDPEVFIGEQNVFVYYNVIDGPGVTPYEVRRCRSELTAAGTSASRSVAQTDPEVCQWVSPQDTDPQIDSALAPHYVCLDPSVSQRGRLLVFFPGTAATPEDYELFAEEGAAVGLHTISLSYPNPRSVNLQICPGDPDPNCHENARREVIYGQDLHSGVSVDEPNAIVNRIVHLLRFLHEQTPDAGWDQYLDGDMPRWEHIVVAGHSQGAGMAAYLAHAHPVARAILFAWVDQSQGNVAPWILEAHATPPERIYYFEHVADHERGKIAKGQMLEAFGLHALGEANIDTTIAPYGDAHVLFTSVTPAREGARASAGAHNVVIGDDFTPVENGVPALREVWRYLLDVPN
ncbi:MAG: hypothetical protein GYB66_16755, partial [Chloroflexi bacterium]|nr:hypothetical protein [Chloroflexota bacterium]